jgi:hypothetical protein
MSYGNVVKLLESQFNERLMSQQVAYFIKDFGRYYTKTEHLIFEQLLKSSILHADETPISIQGINQYVWVFTNGEYVIFKLTKTREAKLLHELLGDYEGVLISDFYSGYDSLQCRQQKCWVHLVRNLNDDLWAAPYDVEFEAFVLEIKNLIIPIMETVQKYGLRKRNLNKFRKQVDKFYCEVITDKYYKSELTIKYQNRFLKYRDSLFTFLEQDNIPWHNNRAETAIRHIALQDRMSGHLHASVAQNYLILLGIRQTCRFQGKSFFKFLFSGETDLIRFEARKRKRRV